MINFGVVAFIDLKALDSACFNVGDISLSLIALIFSMLVEITTIREKNG